MERLRALRTAKGLRQIDMAEYLGVNRTTYVKYETGDSEPTFSTLQRLGKFFNVTADYLMGHGGLLAPGIGVKVPVLGRVQAGLPVEAVQDIIDYEEITQQLAQTGEFFCLLVRGESMQPRIMESDTVIVRKQNSLQSGDVGIVLVNGNDATVKKVLIHTDGITLIAYNPLFQPVFYSNEQIQSLPIAILGKVVEFRARL